MRILLYRLVLASLMTVTPVLASAHAAILSDPFTDGAKVGGADNSGIAWYDRSANASLNIADDTAGLGTGNALSYDPTNTGTLARGFTGVFTGGSISLANVGDSLNLAFNFRFKSTPVAASTPTTAPLNSTAGLTFGFYNSNSTVIAAEDSANQDNDFGYRADIGSGTTSAISLNKETNSGAGGTGTTTASDTTVLTLDPGFSTVMIDTFANHSAQFRLTRTATGIDLLVSIDGVTKATSSNNASPFLTFDEIVFSQNGGGFRIDNVVVTAIPEPSTVLLAVGGLGVLGWRQLRRREISVSTLR